MRKRRAGEEVEEEKAGTRSVLDYNRHWRSLRDLQVAATNKRIHRSGNKAWKVWYFMMYKKVVSLADNRALKFVILQ